MQTRQPFQLIPEYRDYVWGGSRLRPRTPGPTAEAWVIYAQDRIASGPWAGQTLAEAADALREELLGRRAVRQTGGRFPLLIKLLDCAQWLSLQVHPNDEQAARLEGPGFFGKTEAWHVLEADAGAQLIAGLKQGLTPQTLEPVVRSGKTLLDWAQYLDVHAGDTIFMRPGTLHALGPGMLIYEVQQTSDLTYRVYDWDRPQTGRRVLHLDKSLAVIDLASPGRAEPAPALPDGGRAVLCESAYFTLELLAAQTRRLALDTGGETFHALTVIDGAAEVVAAGQTLPLARFESVVIPAICGSYELRPVGGGFRLLKSSVGN
jgi:mannose-6-phosphate isomerase